MTEIENLQSLLANREGLVQHWQQRAERAEAALAATNARNEEALEADRAMTRALARSEALEEAAQVCDGRAKVTIGDKTYWATTEEHAKAIRALALQGLQNSSPPQANPDTRMVHSLPKDGITEPAAGGDTLLQKEADRRAVDWLKANASSEGVFNAIAYEQASELDALRSVAAQMAELLQTYRADTPLGHQPHMIAHPANTPTPLVDAVVFIQPDLNLQVVDADFARRLECVAAMMAEELENEPTYSDGLAAWRELNK